MKYTVILEGRYSGNAGGYGTIYKDDAVIGTFQLYPDDFTPVPGVEIDDPDEEVEFWDTIIRPYETMFKGQEFFQVARPELYNEGE